MKASLGLRAGLLSLLIFAAIVLVWQIAAQPTASSGTAATAARKKPSSTRPSE